MWICRSLLLIAPQRLPSLILAVTFRARWLVLWFDMMLQRWH
nr:MAG TPA: hypothetical protein [Caudoviricetes sp.]